MMDISEYPTNLKWSKCDQNSGGQPSLSCKFKDKTNTCYSSTSVYSYDMGNRKVCAFERKCNDGYYIDDNCNCVSTQDCYHYPGCQVPKLIRLSRGTCKLTQWEDTRSEICAYKVTLPHCDQNGYDVELPYIVDSSGELRIVKTLNIMWKTTTQDDFYMNTNDHAQKNFVNGDQSYCNLIDGNDDCYKPTSEDKPYRGLVLHSMRPFFLGQNCTEPIYCYGNMLMKVFNYPKLAKLTRCDKCSAMCNDNELHFITNLDQKKHIKICGKYNCKILHTSEMVVNHKRDFHSKVNDDRFHIIMSTEDKEYQWDGYSDCPVLGVCDALDCYLCYDYVLNPTCYNWVMWSITGTIIWLIVFTLFMLLSVCKPLVLFIRLLLQTIMHIARWIYKLIWYTCSTAAMAVKARKERLDVQIMDGTPSKESPHVVYIPKSRSSSLTRSGPTTKDDPELKRLLAKRTLKYMHSTEETRLTIISMILLGLILCGSTKAEAPCSSSDITTLQTEDCSLRDNKLVCEISTIMTIKLFSYDQTSCGYLRSQDGTILAKFQITPLDISLRCEKESMYFTREARMNFQTMSRCPGAGQCKEKWCSTVNNSTKIDGWGPIAGPVRQWCKGGESCAAHGCWYCDQPTCHPFRYFPETLNENVYEVFRCAKWTPVSTISIHYKTEFDEKTTTLELTHGSTSIVSSNVKISLELSLAEHLPILVRHFISEGGRMASAVMSEPGMPIAGQVGQIQCNTNVIANKFKDCSLAPGICHCTIEFDGGACDCTDVTIEPMFSGPDSLPLQIDDYYMETKREKVYLKVPAYGYGKVSLAIKGRVSAVKEGSHQCHLTVVGTRGCYSCLRGAIISYKCISSEVFSTMMDCGDFSTVIHCDTSSSVKEAAIRVETPIGKYVCQVACSKDKESVQGTFQHISHPELNEASHIQLIPKDSSPSNFEFGLSILKNFSLNIVMWLIAITLGGYLCVRVSLMILSAILHRR